MAQVGRALAQRLGSSTPAVPPGTAAGRTPSRPKWTGASPPGRSGSRAPQVSCSITAMRSICWTAFISPCSAPWTQIPGVPPTAAHIKDLTTTLAGKRAVVLYASYQSAAEPQALARQLGWPAQGLPLEPPLDANGEGYLHHIDLWVEAIAAGKR